MSKKKQEEQEDETVDLLHRTLIEDEKIDVDDLPEDIQSLLSKFNDLEAKYGEEPSEELFFELQELDATIADEIQSYIEDSTVEEEEEQDYDPNEEEEADGNKNNNVKSNQNQKSEIMTNKAEKVENATTEKTESTNVTNTTTATPVAETPNAEVKAEVVVKPEKKDVLEKTDPAKAKAVKGGKK